MDATSLSSRDVAALDEEAKKKAVREEKRLIQEMADKGAYKNAVCGHVRPTRAPEGELLTNVSVYRFSCGCIHLVGEGENCVTSEGWWEPTNKKQ
jgi:hypothetical protein